MQVLLYSKLAKSYFVFLEALCHNHHAFLVRQPHDTFACIMRCLELGVKSLDVTTSSQCAMAIDNLATWVHQNLIKVDELHQVHPAAQVPPLRSPLGTQSLFRELSSASAPASCIQIHWRADMAAGACQLVQFWAITSAPPLTLFLCCEAGCQFVPVAC